MKKKLLDLGLDLLVVFIGVFAAFQLSDLKESRKETQTKLRYFESFKKELESVNQDVITLKDTIGTILRQYETAIAKGEQPELLVPRKLYFISKPHIVESAFDSDIFNNLHPNYLVSISRGSNLFYWIDHSIKSYKSRCKNLLYNTERKSSYYYDQYGLKKEYQWYLDDLKEIHSLLDLLQQSIEKGAIPGTEYQMKQMK